MHHLRRSDQTNLHLYVKRSTLLKLRTNCVVTQQFLKLAFHILWIWSRCCSGCPYPCRGTRVQESKCTSKVHGRGNVYYIYCIYCTVYYYTLIQCSIYGYTGESWQRNAVQHTTKIRESGNQGQHGTTSCLFQPHLEVKGWWRPGSRLLCLEGVTRLDLNLAPVSSIWEGCPKKTQEKPRKFSSCEVQKQRSNHTAATVP